MALVAILGILMVSTLRYTSFKTVGTGRRNLYIVLLIAAVGMLMWLYSQYILLLIAALYVSHGVIWYFISLMRRHPVPAESKS
jgi:CDP-diacylglycerol--serine O-phosphatidyltransferase